MINAEPTKALWPYALVSCVNDCFPSPSPQGLGLVHRWMPFGRAMLKKHRPAPFTCPLQHNVTYQ